MSHAYTSQEETRSPLPAWCGPSGAENHPPATSAENGEKKHRLTAAQRAVRKELERKKEEE